MFRRASIDRKLDVLTAYTREAKQRAIRRAVPVAVVLAAALTGFWAWRRRSAPKPRRSLRVARAAAAFR
jgi:hypothetical protein